MLDRSKKYYCFAFILYKDARDYSYNNVLDIIRQNWTNFGYIEHSPELEEKKHHTHVLVQFPNKRYIKSIAKELNIAENYIQPVHLIPYLKYLIHFDDEEKIQYSPYEVVGPLQKKLLTLLTNATTEDENAQKIYNYISSYKGYLSLSTLSEFILINSLYSPFRRNYTYFKDLMLDHNRLF